MPLPILPLLLAAGAAIAAIAMSSKAPTPGGTPLPPGTSPTAPLPHGPNNPYDNGLTAQQVVAIQTALSTETNPDNLDSFAKSLLPEFPIAAAALTSRAIALRLAAAANVPPPAAPVVPLPPAGVIFPPVAPAVAPALNQPAPLIIPVVASSFPQSATVITNDTGPSGALLVRATPDANGATVGSNAHGATVLITGPATNGFYPVAGTGGVGFSSAQYLQLTGPVSIPVPAVPGLPASPLITPASFTFPSFPQVGSQAIIATADAGPSGALNLRATPDANGTIIGSNAHGATVTISGPLSNGFYQITSPAGLGYSSAQYLAAAPVATVSAGNEQVGGKVVVTANVLGLRGSPDARAPYIAKAAKGSTFTVAGPSVGGYIPLRDDAGSIAWASPIYIAALQGATTGLANDVGAGPSIAFADLSDAAMALKTALAVHGCRSYNEPLVKDFQRLAKAAGIYAGNIDGWYGTVTQASLSKIVGKPAPACFPNATGGPSNPNEYWSPMGV